MTKLIKKNNIVLDNKKNYLSSSLYDFCPVFVTRCMTNNLSCFSNILKQLFLCRKLFSKIVQNALKNRAKVQRTFHSYKTKVAIKKLQVDAKMFGNCG